MPRRLFLSFFVISCLAALFLAANQPIAVAQSPELVQQIEPLQAASEVDSVSSQQAIGALATSVLYPPDDAPVREGAPNATAPTQLYLGAGYDNGSLYGSSGRIRSYLRFDLSSLPANSTITSATLRLYQAAGRDYEGQLSTVTLYRVTGNWTETGLTWNNRPNYAEAVGSISTTYNFIGWKSLDLTNLVRAWKNGSQANYGLVAVGPEGSQGIYRAFASGETTNSPELHINYLPAPPPVLDASPGVLSARAKSGQGTFGASVQISNVTLGSLNWTATKVGSVPWLNLGASSGSVTPTRPYNLGLTVNPTSLAPGIHTGQIRLSSSTPNVQNSPLTVTYTLDVVNQLSNIYLPIITGGGGGSNPQPQVVALVIGIADYQYIGPAPTSSDTLPDEWGFDLVAPVKDAKDMTNILQTQMGVPPSNITELTDNEATLNRIRTAFSQVAVSEVVAQSANKNTTFIFYYSGHGAQNPDFNGDESDGFDEFIAAYDTNIGPNGFERILTDDDLQVLLANLPFERIVLIIDSCFSGGLTGATVQAAGTSDLRLRGLSSPFGSSAISAQSGMSEIAGPGRVVITAGTGNQLSWESAQLQNGVFTYFYLQGLQDALHDTNQNHRISAEEAYWFTKDAVDDWIFTRQEVHQNPAISDQNFGQADLTQLP